MEVVVVDGRNYPEAVAGINDPFQCTSLVVFLSGEGSDVGDNYSYQWTTEDGIILSGANSLGPQIDGEGNYVIEVTDNDIGCVSRDTLMLVVQEQSLVGVDVEIIPPTCKDFGNAQLNLTEVIGGYGPFNVFVDDNDYGSRDNIPFLSIGEHHLMIIDSLGCEYDTTVVITEEGVLTVALPMDTTICFGDSLMIQPEISIGPDSIQSIVWSSNISCNGCQEVLLTPNQDLTISIEVIDLNGCIQVDEMNVKVVRPNNLPFPQIFSPNGDNINDIFYMPMTKGLRSINYIRIYDNWGGFLYEGRDLIPGDASRGWDGTVNGQNTEIGVYIVEALVTLEDGSEVIYVGDLTLVR